LSRKPPSVDSSKLSKSVPKDALRDVEESKNFIFSFQHWKQREFFGLENQKVNKEWFVDLLDSLRDLSALKVDEVRTGSRLKDVWRFHPITSWGASKSAITEEEFWSFAPRQYRTQEFDAYQFGICKSKGRVGGFFDEADVFNVLILDPCHNLQLSNYNDYTVIQTSALGTSYNRIVGQLAFVKSKLMETPPEKLPHLHKELQAILTEEGIDDNHLPVFLDSPYHQDVRDLLQHDHFKTSLDMILMEAFDILKEKYLKK
jgi:hypothetical protein